MTDPLLARLADLDARLRDLGSVLVAFSGGADSAFLLAAAVRALGAERVVAATSTSAALASGEWEAAARFAATMGVRHRRVATGELQRPGYAANGPDRCFHCKSELLDVLVELAPSLSVAHVATGTNADDVRAPHRPGLRAAIQRGVVTPLADAGLTKVQVRDASRRWGLPTWDKPQAACLASRIAYGTQVDAGRLERVDRAEAAVRRGLAAAGIPVRDLRVRDLGDAPVGARARVEVDADQVDPVRTSAQVLTAVLAEGFADVEVAPFRSGALNEALLPGQRIPGPASKLAWRLPIVD